MSLMTEMAQRRVEEIDEILVSQLDHIATCRAELAEAEARLAKWQAERAELVEFIASVSPSPPTQKDTI